MYSTVVVGAGMIGSSAAKWASEMSPDGGVLLVGEGEDGLYRAWSDEGRITRVFDLNPNWRELAAESIKRYKDIEKESGIMFFHEVGYLTLVDENYPNPKKLTDTAEELNNTGYTCTKIAGKAEAAASSFPYLDLLPGVWGFSQPDKAGHLSPRALVAAQQKLAEARGCVTKEPRHSYCQALYFNNPPKLMPDQTKRTLLKAAAHTGQCTPTHFH